MKREQLKTVRYQLPLSETEQLAVQTCPGYNKALDRAIADTFHQYKCWNCRLEVMVGGSFYDEVTVWGKCPKL
jgi:hypothetical protein